MRAREIEAYRRRLAKITTPDKLTSECLAAVVTAKCVEYDQPVTGVLLALEHYIGEGLVGPMVWTRIKLCFGCVDRLSPHGCTPEMESGWVMVSWLESVRRNGDAGAES